MVKIVEDFVKQGDAITRLNTHKGKQNSLVKLNKFTATPIVAGKFWIMEQLGRRVGTLQKDHNSFVFLKKNKEYFESETDLMSKYAVNFIQLEETPVKNEKEVHGYPVKDIPHNSILDIRNGIPLYTKTEKSKSFFCAGYYVIKFKQFWSPAFCPKSITLNRYDYLGPFKTKMEQRDSLRNINKKEKRNEM